MLKPGDWIAWRFSDEVVEMLSRHTKDEAASRKKYSEWHICEVTRLEDKGIWTTRPDTFSLSASDSELLFNNIDSRDEYYYELIPPPKTP